MAWQSPIALGSLVIYAYELWTYTPYPSLQGSIVLYAGVLPVFQELCWVLFELPQSSKEKPHSNATRGKQYATASHNTYTRRERRSANTDNRESVTTSTTGNPWEMAQKLIPVLRHRFLSVVRFCTSLMGPGILLFGKFDEIFVAFCNKMVGRMFISQPVPMVSQT